MKWQKRVSKYCKGKSSRPPLNRFNSGQNSQGSGRKEWNSDMTCLTKGIVVAHPHWSVWIRIQLESLKSWNPNSQRACWLSSYFNHWIAPSQSSSFKDPVPGLLYYIPRLASRQVSSDHRLTFPVHAFAVKQSDHAVPVNKAKAGRRWEFRIVRETFVKEVVGESGHQWGGLEWQSWSICEAVKWREEKRGVDITLSALRCCRCYTASCFHNDQALHVARVSTSFTLLFFYQHPPIWFSLPPYFSIVSCPPPLHVNTTWCPF